MFTSLRRVILPVTAVLCLLIGLFWLWFWYEFSLKWVLSDTMPGLGDTAVVFYDSGIAQLGFLAFGWLLLAVVLVVLHRRWRVPPDQS
ncbi:MAG: hypothetical protein H6654_13400 [Ardenticatenaceae bacterium]|nr:hypothetical protein [Anaerolineales bacterium]MCB8941557.1 hypothetical protein [Ardenticatenaceae bacterium]MCB8974549.1 hypothetical protein [Ardenticatenaceae bacterium]